MSENKEEPYHGSRDFGSHGNRYASTMAMTASFTNSSYADDMRISKILRRLSMETNPSAAVELCKHLEVAVRSPSNSSYICRSFGPLLEGIVAVLRQSPPQCLNEVSFVLGLVGYINHSAFLDYKSVLAKAYRSFPAIRKYIAMALRVTFSYDAVNLELLAYSDDLIVMLKDYLENVDSESELFVALTETIVEFSRNYKYSFEHNFTDIVDIVVGWHLEAEQPLSIKIHCSSVLQQLSPYFYGEYNFTIDLMGQFLEDILPLNDELMSLSPGKDTKVLAQKMTTFIGAFNTILKALYTKIEYADLTACEPLLKAMYDVVMKCPELVMAQGYLNVETVLNINDFICLILMNNTFAHLADVAHLEHIIRLQCANMRHFSDEQQLSLLYTILVIVREFRTAIPCSMVTVLFQPQDNFLRDALWKRDSRQYKLLLKIYHSVLMLKNVPLLQEAYKHIRADIADIMGRLEAGTGNMTRDSVAFTFHLTALAALAMQTSSIIGMYALYPSILELLVNNCQAANLTLWAKYPTLHRALLQVVITHATKNHYFLSTSRLFSDQEANSSRTADNYSLILRFVADIMSAADQMNENLLKLLVAFLRELFDESRPYAALLKDNAQFLSICRSLPRAGSRIPHECGATIEVLLDYASLHTDALRSLRDMVMLQFEASDKAVRELYMRLFAKLPLDITLMHLKEMNSSDAAEASKTYELQQWYRANMKCPIRDKHFKTFLDALNVARSKEAAAPPALATLSHSSFLQSWSVQLSAKAMDYQGKAYANSAVRELWMQYEAARYCVRNKLRTIIGKPQETFLAIEAIIGMYARIILAKADDRPKLGEYAEIRSNSQMLLGFYESLEKLIYNATEGTAFALSPLEKAASTFFRINAHTCHEWFKRIRNSVSVVAQFSSQFDMVTRLSETILKEASVGSDAAHMDQNIITLAWALINAQEDDTLMGLHVWCKGKFGRRYTWLQHTADQVAGRKEKAFEGYWSHLKENDSELSDKLKVFILDQMLECLYFTGQWAKMAEACSRMPERQCNLLNARPATQLNVLQEHMGSIAAADLNSTLNAALLEFSDWSHIGRVKDSAVTSNFTRDMVRQQESDFVNSMIQQEGGGTKGQDIITQEIQEWMRGDNARKSLDSFADYIILNCLSHQQEQGPGLLKTSCALGFTEEESRVPSTVLTKCLFWQALTERYSQMPTKATPRLYLDVASNARLEGNVNYCRMMLERFFSAKGYEGAIGQIADKLQQQDDAAWFIEDSEILRGYGELTKYTFNKSPSVAIEMASDLCLKIVRNGSAAKEDANVHEIGANMLLTIADWLGQRGHNSSTIGEPSSKLHALIQELPEQERVSRADHVMIPQVERAIGCLISGSIYERETSAEAWCAYGNWCYRWGKKIMESKNSEGATPHSTLTHRDLALIREVCGNDIGEAQLRQLVDILNSHQLRVYDDCLDDIDAADTNSTELIELEVRKIETFASMPVEQIANIIRIWRKAYKNLYTHYEMATEAYFRYLALENSDAVAANGGTGGPECGIDSEGDIEDSSLVTVTLRLLRLIAKHAIGLQDVLEEGLKTTPLRPWRIIIPQLFSRLNHHEPYVRKSVSELLCRLAKAKPDLIIFPVIVGAEQELKAGQKQQNLAANIQQTSLSTCFHSLLTALSSQAPESVLHVRLLIKELKRISLLWEEYWLHSLVKLYNEYSTHFVTLDAELKKCPATATDALRSVKEKYELTMSHLSSDFEVICQTTEKPPETTYERCFQERFGPVIRSTLAQLRRPLDLSKPNENWLSIKQLYTIMQKRQLRGSSSSMKLNDLSPILGGMLDSAICMPGVDTYGSKQNVYIKSVDSVVYVLPTKTKPKKLSFYGSNGRKYSYLFKGLEDLHLDERIMQFLSITNSMMARSSDKQFKALHYSVIPLGPQSGLISWVDGVVPLFSIYKKWQQRQISFKESTNNNANNANTTSSTAANQDPAAVNIGPTRPSELFYNKLLPLLAELNIKPSDPRKMWPLSVLRRVLKELSDETPRDLLAKELWCSALTAADWRKSVRNYTASVAVMSVIGYVIGLGDRHLDNVLIKAATGEIVHIDYNVCFEKGKTLRVPEKVPFRLTANLTEAMGLTGIEGGFRLGCEKVLRILRKERETLLTLLEAFVYDPLVDWTVNDDEKAIKTRLAMAGTSEFALNSLNPQSARLDPASNSETCNQKSINRKFDDIKKYWDVYNDDVHLQLGETCTSVRQLLQLHMRLNENEVRRRSISQQIAMIRELETLGPAIGSHRLNTLSLRFSTWQKDNDTVAGMRQEVEKTFAEVNQVVANFVDGLNEESTQKLLAIDIELRKRLDRSEPTPLSVLRDETQMILRTLASDFFGQINRQIDSLRATEFCFDEAVMRCARIVHEYTEIIQYWPTSRLREHKAFALQHDMAVILSNGTVNDDAEALSKDNLAPGQNIQLCEYYLRGMEQLCTDLKCQMLDVETSMSQNNRELSVAGILEDLQRILEANVHNRALLQSLVAGILYQAYQESWLVHDPQASTVYKDINFLRSMHKLIAESGCFEHVDVVCIGINLMWHPLVLVDEMKAVVEGHALKRLVRLFMTDNDGQLQDELLALCRDMSKETTRRITNGELILLLDEISRVFDDFTLNMLKLFSYLKDKVSSDTNTVVTRYLWDHSGFAAYVERLKNRTLSEVFRRTFELVAAFNTNDATNIYDVRLVVAPMGEFVAEFEKSILPGLTSIICKDVLQEIAQPLNLSAYDESTVRLADYLCKDLYGRLQLDATQMQLLQQLRGQKKHLLVAQHIGAAYYWLNEKHFAGKYVHLEHIVSKAKLLEPLVDVMDQVALRQNEMTILFNVYGKHLTEAIDAAQFPLLNEYMSSERKQMHDSIDLANQVMVFARACHEFETACEPNGPYTQLVAAWRKACERLQKSSAAITADEREIVQMLDPEGQVDHYWIANVNGLYEEMTVAVQRDLEALKAEEKAAEVHLQEHCKQLDALIAPFVRLDIRSLLKLILKNEKQRGQLADTSSIAKTARQLLATVKQFFATLSELQQTLNESNFTAAILTSAEQKIATCLEVAQRNYATLGELMKEVNEAAIEWDPLDADDDTKAKASVAAGEKSASTSSTVLVEQKRNAYAVSVWKRIRLKLEGRDPEAQHRSSISEQIDYIIQEATNLDNLAVLYEGWTPWV